MAAGVKLHPIELTQRNITYAVGKSASRDGKKRFSECAVLRVVLCAEVAR